MTKTNLYTLRHRVNKSTLPKIDHIVTLKKHDSISDDELKVAVQKGVTQYQSLLPNKTLSHKENTQKVQSA